MTSERLEEIRARHAALASEYIDVQVQASRDFDRYSWQDMADLLAEVDRLRAHQCVDPCRDGCQVEKELKALSAGFYGEV